MRGILFIACAAPISLFSLLFFFALEFLNKFDGDFLLRIPFPEISFSRRESGDVLGAKI